MRNEWDKLWKRKRWLMVIGLLILIVGGTVLAQNARSQTANATRLSIHYLQQAMTLERKQLKGGHLSAKQRTVLKQELAMNEQAVISMKENPFGRIRVRQDLLATQKQLAHSPAPSQVTGLRIRLAMDRYMLTHGIRQYTTYGDGGWILPGIVAGGPALLLLAFLVVLLTADLVAGERHDGTLSVLFLHVANRRAILAAKCLVAVLTAWGATAVSMLGWWLVGGLVMGFGSPWMPHAVGVRYAPFPDLDGNLALAGTHWILLPQWEYDLAGLGLALVSLGAWAILVTAISTAFRAVNLATGISAVVLLSGIFLNALRGQSWILAVPTLNLSLLATWSGQVIESSGVTGATLGVGVIAWLGWAVLALGYGVERFERLEP